MTDREKAIVMAYTGFAMLTGDKLEVFYKYVESLVNHPVFTHELASIDLKALSKKDFLDLCAKEERTHGEWIENTRYKRKGKIFLDCSVCHYGENGDVICEVSKLPNFCPNCGALMSASYRQVTGKLNSEIEKSKSEICPCIECCKIDNSERCRKGCSDYQKWKEVN